MSKIKIATVFNIELEFETAELSRRILAYLVDLILLTLYFITVKNLLYSNDTSLNIEDVQKKMGIDILVISLPMLMYSLVCEVAMHGQSVGKRMLDIRVLSLDGKEPDLGQCLTRWIFRVFEWPFFFGYTLFSIDYLYLYLFTTGFMGIGVAIAIAYTSKSQRLGDLAANTVVVRTKSDFTVEDTLYMPILEKDYKATFPQVMRLSDRDINTIHRNLKIFQKTGNMSTCKKLAEKIQSILQIETKMEPPEFLETLIEDYNYLAGK